MPRAPVFCNKCHYEPASNRGGICPRNLLDNEVDGIVNNYSSVSKGFQLKFTPKLIQSSSNLNNQSDPKFQKDYKAEYKKMKAKLALLKASLSSSQNPTNFQPKNKGVVAETFDWDRKGLLDEEERYQSNGNSKALDDDGSLWKECRDELLILKQAKLDAVTFQIQNTELTKLNHALQEQLKEEKKYQGKICVLSTSSKKRLNLDSKLPNFNTGRILGHESQAVNESFETSNTPESSKDSEAEFLTPLPPLKNLQGASPSPEVMPLTFQPHYPKERPGLGIMKHTKPKAHDSSTKSVSGTVTMKRILYCMICKKEDHRTSDHEMYIALLKRSESYKAQPYQYASSFKQILKAKAKTFLPCTHYGLANVTFLTLYTLAFLWTTNGVLITSKERHIREPIWYLDSGWSRSMTSVKSYLHKYVEQPCPKFDDKQGTIFNAKKEIVLIALRRNGVYVLDMSSLTPNGACFFPKASESFIQRINLAQHVKKGITIELHSKLNKTSLSHLLHMDLFGPVSPMSINHEKYTLFIIDEYSRCPVFIHNHKDHLGKFNAKADDGYYLGYSFVSKAFRVYNTRRQQIEETYHVTFDESMEAISSHPVPQDRWSRDQHIELVNIIGDPGKGMLTRSMAAKLTVASASECLFDDFLSEIEPKKASEALKHPGWIDAMQEERNKKDEHGTTAKNKARLVAQGYSQEEGIDYDETFAPVAMMEAIRIFLRFAIIHDFKLYQWMSKVPS
ncbi:retrovirus-related pol polyprotein from transposon TNT 1-94 [Tanacetum coccineum]|uniref:Retrovirus-related pol polyprotein from transposon TNT 1-94 n=1 Tax=Tanacetum coccineum TaxID=301880 RepID=A0ABQ5AZP6_9ASTR